MKKITKFFSVLALSLCAMFSCLFAGCEDDSYLELSKQGAGNYTVTPGQTIQFETKTNLTNQTIKYFVKTGDATFNDEGLLTVATTAQVDSTIEVYAAIGELTSNVISIVVVDLAPSAITLTTDNDKIAKGGAITYTVAFTPTYATDTQYDIAITGEGAQYVQLDNNTITIKEDAVSANIENKTFNVVATLKSDSTITSSQTITIVKADEIFALQADNIEYIVAQGSNKSMVVTARNEAGYALQDIDITTFAYSYDESVIYIDKANNCKITPKKHGQTTVTITAPNGVSTTCNVFVMIPPSVLHINGVSTQINDTREMSYSKQDLLDLDVSAENNLYPNCSDKLEYTFELLDEDRNVINSGDEVATIQNGKILFNVEGFVKVTIKSNSALNNNRVVASFEKSTYIFVNVNNGINVDSVEQLVAYANQNTNIVANITQDIYLTETHNFGQSDKVYNTLFFRGDRTIFGNGYVISNERLPLLIADGDGNQGVNMLEFSRLTNGTPFTVKIYDLEVIGCGGVEGKYSGELEAFKDEPVVNFSNGDYIRTYRRGIKISGENMFNVPEGYVCTKAYAKDLVLSNVKVSGFDVAIRTEHIVNGILSNVRVANCLSNGIETSQDIITFNNIDVGKVGAYAIEITPDDVGDKNTSAPKTCAGANYDQTPHITFTGYVRCANYTNGLDTPYMQNFANKVKAITHAPNPVSVLDIANTILLTHANNYATAENAEQLGMTQEQLQTALTNAVKPCMFKESMANLYLLIFVDPTQFTSYNYGNTQNVFAQYAYNSSQSDMINVTEIMQAYLADPDYDGYKQYKYICLDLDTGAMLGNIGQMVIINEQYDPNYVA